MKKLPYNIKYTLTVLIIALIFNQGSYNGAKFIAGGWDHSDLSLPIDGIIPFVPWTITLYLISYLIWLFFYTVISRGSEKELKGMIEKENQAGGYDRDRFFAADILSKIICFIFFLALPTTLTRPVPGTETAIDTLVTFVYQVDSADNLFPSIHCIVSWLCWIGVRNRADLPSWLKNSALVLAILICISTLTTKQHVIIDVFGGILLAELCYFLTGFDSIRKLYTVPMKKLLKAVAKP